MIIATKKQSEMTNMLLKPSLIIFYFKGNKGVTMCIPKGNIKKSI
jgi:hypothetical protein